VTDVSAVGPVVVPVVMPMVVPMVVPVVVPAVVSVPPVVAHMVAHLMAFVVTRALSMLYFRISVCSAGISGSVCCAGIGLLTNRKGC